MLALVEHTKTWWCEQRLSLVSTKLTPSVLVSQTRILNPNSPIFDRSVEIVFMESIKEPEVLEHEAMSRGKHFTRILVFINVR